MLLLSVRYIFLFFALFVCLQAEQMLSPVEFLQQLIDNPSRTPMYEEGIKVMDQIASMSPDEVRMTVPVIFTALSSPNVMAQLKGALALDAVSLRPDGPSFLNSRINDVLGLLSKDGEVRIKMMAIIVAKNLRTPPATMRPVLSRFIADLSQPDTAKPGAIFALLDGATSFPADMVRPLGQLYSQIKDPSTRVETLNAIASNPMADPGQISLVIAGLHDTSPDVRVMAIAILNRLGPKALSQVEADLRIMAQNPEESPNVRQAAANVLKINPYEKTA